MNHLEEFRDPALVQNLLGEIRRSLSRPVRIMEICGGQTHSIVRNGLDELLPPELVLLHGPGCPVCVTAEERVAEAMAIARRPEVIFCSFGDMLRVPAFGRDLATTRAEGADVRVIYSPLDAVNVARQNPARQVVLFAVGFETTAPTTAQALLLAERWQLSNFSVLLAHVRVPPALESLLSAPATQIDALLAAGHVCAVMGLKEYYPVAHQFRIPIVATGFEPVDILEGILMAIRALNDGRSSVENQYHRVVQEAGNPSAQAALAAVFLHDTVPWRGLGKIPDGGYKLTERFLAFDATERFRPELPRADAPHPCWSAKVLTGQLHPRLCPEFGKSCTPESPLGAPMVSSEGACAAYFRYNPEGARP